MIDCGVCLRFFRVFFLEFSSSLLILGVQFDPTYLEDFGFVAGSGGCDF